MPELQSVTPLLAAEIADGLRIMSGSLAWVPTMPLEWLIWLSMPLG